MSGQIWRERRAEFCLPSVHTPPKVDLPLRRGEERRPGMLLPLSDFWCTSLMLQNGHAATPPATAVTDCTHRRRRSFGGIRH